MWRENRLRLISTLAKASEIGGLSGRPLFPLALHAVRTIRPLLPPSIPVIGCGGISTASDAISMARAGASIVQLYTSFGYRGIGTPALLKDEISAELSRLPGSISGQTWKSQIGRDWADKDMGWDERRLEKESKALKQEAEGLGQMLRKAFEEDDLARLIKEAEVALGGPRDNLAGARPAADMSPESEKTSDVAQALIGAMQADESRAGSAVPHAIEPSAPEPGVRVSEPLGGGPFGPIVVQEVKSDVEPVPKQEDAWTGAVRRGNKRLV